MTKSILITGASGFLGRHVLNQLESVSSLQPLLAIRSQAAWENQEWTKKISRPTLVESDLFGLSQTDLPPLDTILHMAAHVIHNRTDMKAVDEMYRVNIEGTLQMVELAKKHQARLIFVSTSGTVGCSTDPRFSASEDAPYLFQEVKRWPYYHSKIQAEIAAQKRARELNLDLTIVRPPMLIGPYDHRGRSTRVIQKYVKNQLPFSLKGSIHVSDIRDVAGALIRLAQHPNPKRVYHLPGHHLRLNDYFAELNQVLDRQKTPVTVPTKLALTLAHLGQRFAGPHTSLPDPVMVEMGSSHWGLRSQWALEDLGYQSRELQKTLKDTVNWINSPTR